MKLACFLKGNTFLCYGIENATDRWKLERAFLQPLSGKNVPVFLKKNQTFHPVHVKKTRPIIHVLQNHRSIFTLLALSLSPQLSKNLGII